MSDALLQGLPAALIGAALYGIAPLLQAYAAREEAPGGGVGLGLLARLALRPLWLAGLASEAVSFLFEVYALSKAPVALVAPVMACDMVVFALLARRTLGERISRPGKMGIASMAVGIALIALAFHNETGIGTEATDGQMFLFGAFGLAFTAVGAVAADRAGRRGGVAQAAVLFGLTAGVCYAIATVATRQLGLLLHGNELGHLMATPTPYVLVVFSVLALSLEQRGLQGRAAVVAFPVTSGVSAFLPVVLGLTLLGETTPGGGQMVAFVIALTMLATGVVGLGRDRATALMREAADQGGSNDNEGSRAPEGDADADARPEPAFGSGSGSGAAGPRSGANGSAPRDHPVAEGFAANGSEGKVTEVSPDVTRRG